MRLIDVLDIINTNCEQARLEWYATVTNSPDSHYWEGYVEGLVELLTELERELNVWQYQNCTRY